MNKITEKKSSPVSRDLGIAGLTNLAGLVVKLFIANFVHFSANCTSPANRASPAQIIKLTRNISYWRELV